MCAPRAKSGAMLRATRSGRRPRCRGSSWRPQVGVGPPVECSLPHAGEIVGDEIVAQAVALVHHGPQGPGARRPVETERVAEAGGEDPHPAAVGASSRIAARRGSLLVDPLLVHVGRRADRDVEPGAVGVGHDVAGPVIVVAARRELEHAARRRRDRGVAGPIRIADQRVGVGDVQPAIQIRACRPAG